MVAETHGSTNTAPEAGREPYPRVGVEALRSPRQGGSSLSSRPTWDSESKTSIKPTAEPCLRNQSKHQKRIIQAFLESKAYISITRKITTNQLSNLLTTCCDSRAKWKWNTIIYFSLQRGNWEFSVHTRILNCVLPPEETPLSQCVPHGRLGGKIGGKILRKMSNL